MRIRADSRWDEGADSRDRGGARCRLAGQRRRRRARATAARPPPAPPPHPGARGGGRPRAAGCGTSRGRRSGRGRRGRGRPGRRPGSQRFAGASAGCGCGVCCERVPRPPQVPVQQTARELVADQRADRRRPHPVLTRAADGRPRTRSPAPRPRAGRSAPPAARRCGSRESTQSNCGVFTAGSCTIVMCTLLLSCSSSARTDSVNPWMRVLRPAVRALQRDAAVRQRRADLHDRAAVARAHPVQRGLRAVDEPEVAHLGRPLELLGGDLLGAARTPR